MTTNSALLVRLSETDETIGDRADDIRHRAVTDRDGADLGKVKDLLIDGTEQMVRFMEVASGGVLGIGKETSFIPVEVITAITENEVRIDQTKEFVAGARAYDPDLVRDREASVGILGYYG